MSRPRQGDVIDAALNRGLSVVLQALLVPENLSEIPHQWRWFVTLHHALCDYLLPGLPYSGHLGGAVTALDMFCTSSETSIGGHYDTGDVFYFVLQGEKEWTVELAPDLETGLRLAAEGTNYTLDRPSLREHMKILVRPGDCLYVPPYTYHRVRSFGQSLAGFRRTADVYGGESSKDCPRPHSKAAGSLQSSTQLSSNPRHVVS